MSLPQYTLNPSEYLEAPPPYSEAPPPELCIVAGSYCTQPVTLMMKGEYRSPDFTLHLPGGDPWYHSSTDSSVIHHETFVKDVARNQNVFVIKRKNIDDMLRYTIHAPGRDGRKLLEVDVKPGTGPGSSIRLIFWNTSASELDELFMSTTEGGRPIDISYRGKNVANITGISSSDPQYRLQIQRAYLDPLLIMILAYILDDGTMTKRRRYRRPLTSGLAGVGRGPGAGLAGAFALGSII